MNHLYRKIDEIVDDGKAEEIENAICSLKQTEKVESEGFGLHEVAQLIPKSVSCRIYYCNDNSCTFANSR